ncbi:cupin domain-containing protein [Paenibacillus agilis]|uniref:Cupin domain-containing protein n=1 Tax=Paenibacillus agilis TaxID=3020863 RepID=A0A559J3B7_9BACL|nr:cupin domain-containing protein [Paenibacillus agilis]TVX94369.1 cupin domain-containing protein [Paenibacillus agilis]
MCKYEQLEVMNLDQISSSIQDTYTNFVLNKVNESCLRIAVITGEYRWHYHETCDEMFIVLEGELFIDFQDRPTIALKPHDVITIPKGVVHRTRALQRTVNLCFEHLDGDTVFIDESAH